MKKENVQYLIELCGLGELSNKQFIRKAMKNWDSSDAHDWNEKIKVATVLKDGFSYSCFYDRTIFVSKLDFTFSDKQPKLLNKEEILQNFYIFKPDIWIKTHNIIIEIDGLFHFNTIKGVKQTNHRNKIYDYMGVKFVWFTTKQVKESDAAELYQLLKEKL